ncbi:PQQ-binding-like beta-propeller repeat protein [Haloterrigena alkaliphila]|uniref:PQQ-binding-like beta-propeller repeat protein n=1 Tax=Haloterrigena alkaliphila TaxID=2816475 RepID=A0A8A2VAR8_9EURY|nr:PQQ-binding-like beta-propeller repeat protein [Haloterrigena alkaliphila]QSW98206.1 PQQ-like beta-propeller repeat protein [Haloterrigena alkaliphila]
MKFTRDLTFDGSSASDGSGRRALLSATGVALASGLAGCLGDLESDGDGEPEEPDSKSTHDTAALRERLADADPYRMDQYGPAHVGATADEGPTDDVEAVWTFREGELGPAYNIGSPAVVDGTVYVAEGRSVGEDDVETVVYALDGATGDVEWDRTYSGTNSFGSTAVVDGTVVLGIGASVVSLEADSGTERWRLDRDFSDAITVADGTVYAINTTYADPPTLVAIDLETGRERWNAPLTGDALYRPTPPAVVDGTVYQGGADLVALSAADGEQQWSRDLGETVTGSPTVADGALYVPVADGSVAAFDPDGAERWRQPVESGGQGSRRESVTSAAVADGSLYVVSSWQLTALDAETGSERWTTGIRGNDPPVVADGVVYVSGLNTMEAYDTADGTRLWRYGSEAESGSGDPVAPVVGGTVFFPSAGLHALREAGD